MSKENTRPYSVKVNTKITDLDKKNAKDSILKAFQIAGLVSENNIICPNCGNSKKGKIKIKTSAKSGNLYWHCFPCGEHGDAIELLVKFMNLKFNEAINLLLDRDPIQQSNIGKVVPAFDIAPAFIANVDSEIYNYILSQGDQQAAFTYYAVWHIATEAVKEAGSVVLLDPPAIQEKLLKKFSRDRLIKSGVMTIDKNKKDFFLFNHEYNVVEPHLSPLGDVVGMQFRPSVRQAKKVKAHKNWKKLWTGHLSPSGEVLDPSDAWDLAYKGNKEKAGEKVPYVTPFLSLKGASDESLVGCGLWRISKLKKGSKIYIVEGFKDLLAARTMGVEAYAIPGVGVMPPATALAELKKHHMVVMLDGDEAGERGRLTLMNWFKEHGVSASLFPNQRQGLDVADILVEKNAHSGCQCPTCKEWLIAFPYTRENCPCKSCAV